ncbi:MAG: alpha-1,4-glucan--maltose-1-phosphate maltosyltransferase [Candidatus Rokuibacteriota bacterium]|nr:MAG: alpha-1,4-glucan--maltose-1-phosphate maltosyltransferase [Candidatus Rokubacteria bacterium]
MNAPRRTVVIESVAPAVDGGRYPVKREVGAVLEVSADIFKDGHDALVAYLRYRRDGDRAWRESPMHHVDNDRWAGTFTLAAIGRYRYTIEALTEPFRSWLADLEKRHAGGQDLESALGEGLALIRAAAARATAAADRTALGAYVGRIEHAASPSDAVAVAAEPELAALMARHLDRSEATWAERELEVIVDPERARFAAWYEFFPRSGTAPDRSATFKEAEAQLARAAAMGFDVAYLPPIHPIGRAHRKGRDNALVAAPGDPGSPWAIGSADGGYTAVHPDLGTLEDFDRFVEAARRLRLEVALDFAIQCSPDHPWVHEHPEWFFHRPDGTIKYAENPPKKYQDIYPLNFQGEGAQALWEEMRRILEFWIGHGVSTFRVDNPHTKPVKFWEWLIRTIKDAHPEVVFLAEAFTRPKMMKVLAKAGFTQSYTYFTWRNTKQELIDYLTEITTPPVAEYFRGNLWPNTPDILHESLQKGGRPAFRTRLVLAATMSSLYGFYSGYELCENVPREPGSEEYLNSEKYEYKARDWGAPGNLVDYVTRINRIRRENRALHAYTNLRFYPADDPNIVFYGKMTPERDNLVFVAVNLDPFATHASSVDVPIAELGIGDAQSYRVHELIGDRWYDWRGARNYVELHPNVEPAQIFVLHP